MKIYNQIKTRKTTNKTFENSQLEVIKKQKKINLALAIAKYGNCMRKSLKGFLAMPKSQKTFSTPFINYYHRVKKRLEL